MSEIRNALDTKWRSDELFPDICEIVKEPSDKDQK